MMEVLGLEGWGVDLSCKISCRDCLLSDEGVVISVIVAAVVCYHAFVSFLVIKCRFIEPKARKIQLLLIWIVPLIGALICHAVVQSHNAAARVINDSMVKHYEEADKYLLGSGRGERLHVDDSSHGDDV